MLIYKKNTNKKKSPRRISRAQAVCRVKPTKNLYLLAYGIVTYVITDAGSYSIPFAEVTNLNL